MINKYRAFDVEHKTMGAVLGLNMDTSYGIQGVIYLSGNEIKSQLTRDERVVLMPSSGLFDSVGNEIFDGDRVLDDESQYGVVFYSKAKACFMVTINEYTHDERDSTIPYTDSLYRTMEEGVDLVVIGNIHQEGKGLDKEDLKSWELLELSLIAVNFIVKNPNMFRVVEENVNFDEEEGEFLIYYSTGFDDFDTVSALDFLFDYYRDSVTDFMGEERKANYPKEFIKLVFYGDKLKYIVGNLKDESKG